jgi:hypothetical protein
VALTEAGYRSQIPHQANQAEELTCVDIDTFLATF